MEINRPLQTLFQRLDKNKDKGVSLEELSAMDTDQDGQIKGAEAEAFGIMDPQDLSLLNTTLQRASSIEMAPTEILFPVGDERAQEGVHEESADTDSRLADRMTYGAFDPSDPSIGRRLTSIKQALSGTHRDQMKSEGFSYRATPDRSSVASLDVYSNSVRGIQGFDDLRNVNREAITQQLTQDLGRAPTEAEVGTYLQQHGEDMAQLLGADLSGKYSSGTSIGLTGDVGSLDPFRSSGPDDDSVVVCTNIHASVAAYRQEVLGQEAYVMHTDGNDQAHIVTVFKDNQTNTWNIQNYGTVVQTDAKDIRELYENYLPEQRHILLGSVDENSVNIERDVRTSLGEREYRDRTQLGYGNMNLTPNALEFGRENIAVQGENWNVQYDPQLSTLMFNRHTTEQTEDGLRTRGFAVAAQDHTNPQGFQRQRVDAKFESETVSDEQLSEGHQQIEREYWNVHTGLEDTSEAGQIYWQDNDDTGAAARLGARYMFDQTNLYGTGNLRSELGWGVNLGTTVTMATKGDDFYSSYITRTLGDSELSGHGSLGVRYDNGPWMARTGLKLGADLANLNGFSDFGMQMSNIGQTEAYGELNFTADRVRLGVMGNADLMHAGVFDIALMSDVQLTDKFSWATVMTHQNDPLLGNRNAIMTGVQADFGHGISAFTQVGSDLDGDGRVNAGIVWRPGTD